MKLSKVGVKLSFSTSPLGRLPGVQDTGNSSEPIDTGLHIKSHIGREGHNTLWTNPACHSSSNLGLGIKLDKVYKDKEAWTYTGMWGKGDTLEKLFKAVQPAEAD